MEQAQSERIGWVVITLAAFGVGMLLGGRSCASQEAPHGASSNAGSSHASSTQDSKTSRPCEPQLIKELVEAEPRIIYECPPPEPQPKTQGKGGGKAKITPKKLPEPEPELDPQLRKRLLAWVRDQSDSLKPCRDNTSEIYRVAVIMHLDAHSGVIKRVDVNTTRGETPAGLPGCLQKIIGGWEPPEELVQGRTKLVFGLNL